MACITAMPSDKDQHFPLRNAFVSSLQAESFVGSFFLRRKPPDTRLRRPNDRRNETPRKLLIDRRICLFPVKIAELLAAVCGSNHRHLLHLQLRLASNSKR